MSIETEEFLTRNSDGSVSLDPYAGMSRDALKERCGELCRAIDEWQQIAMTLVESGKEGLWPDGLKKVTDLIAAYKD